MMRRNAGTGRFDPGTARRLVGYVTGTYKLRFAFVLFSILVGSAAGVIGSLFLKVLIDDYITPLAAARSADFSGLLRAVGVMAAIYATGVVATYAYNREMVKISQGVQKRIRDEMFTVMQRLPITYFDGNSHGDIMSRYTNDIDTLWQMLSQSIPMLLSSAVMLILIRETSASSTSTSATTAGTRCCTTSPFSPSRDRRSSSSARPARARRQSPT